MMTGPVADSLAGMLLVGGAMAGGACGTIR